MPYSLLRHGAHAFPLLLVKETGAMPPKDCSVGVDEDGGPEEEEDDD